MNSLYCLNIMTYSDKVEMCRAHQSFSGCVEQVAYILLYMLAADGNIGSPYEVLLSLHCLMLLLFIHPYEVANKSETS